MSAFKETDHTKESDHIKDADHTEPAKPALPLWTRDFKIITIGTVISMLGNAISGFALSLMVLDISQSTLLYAIYLIMYTLPKLIMPILSGAWLDRFSRKRTIYTLDFISAGLYALAAIALGMGWYSFPVFAVYCFLLGSIDSIYLVAYESFYPLLITEGNYQKAYSIAGLLETLTAVMVPVSAFLYKMIGMGPLLAVNAASFLIAAIMETQIRQEEKYIELRKQTSQNLKDGDVLTADSSGTDENAAEAGKSAGSSRRGGTRKANGSSRRDGTHTAAGSGRGRQMLEDTREGFQYLLSEKGLLAIAAYFTFSAICQGVSQVITLPYFKSTFDNGEWIFMIVMGMTLAGRGIGASFHYRHKIPVRYKYAIALTVYIMISALEGSFLFMPVPVMMVFMFLTGLGGITSYTIRISATQSYVPDEKKGRFNGAFNMLSTAGALLGEMAAGLMTLVLEERLVLSAAMGICILAAIVFIGGGRKEVSRIYNRQQ